MGKIKLIIFDAGDILFETGMIKFNKIYYKFLKSHNKHNLFGESNKIWSSFHNDLNSGKISQYEVNKLILIKLGIHPRFTKDLIDRDRKMMKTIKLYKGTLHVLKNLRKSGYKLAILTDVVHPKSVLVQFFNRLSLANNVDAIFFSNVIGYAKPHKKSYLIAMKHFNVSASQTVFVGHSKDEILGAGKLGIKTVKFGSEKVRSDYKIKSLPQLLVIMKKLEN